MNSTGHPASLKEAGFTKVVTAYTADDGELVVRVDVIPVAKLPEMTGFFISARVG